MRDVIQRVSLEPSEKTNPMAIADMLHEASSLPQLDWKPAAHDHQSFALAPDGGLIRAATTWCCWGHKTPWSKKLKQKGGPSTGRWH
jgi:hypothetical protein